MDNTQLAAELQQSSTWLRHHLTTFHDSRDRARAEQFLEQVDRARQQLVAAAKGAKQK